MHFFDRCPKNVFDVESGFSRKFTTGPEWIFPPYFWKGQLYMAVPTATNCLLFEIVLEKKARSGIFPPPKEEQERRGEYSFMLFPGLNISNFLCDSYHTWLMHPEACVTDLFIISDYSCLKIIQHASTAPDSFCLGIEINFPWLPSVHPTQSFRSFAARLLSCPSCGSL